MENIILIPAYNPDNKLTVLVEALKATVTADIVVVNDGSSPASSPVFEAIKNKVTLLEHTVNKGKGAAIKTGLKYIQQNHGDLCGIVTVDADGQHSPSDALKLLDTLEQNQDSLVLGCRTFSGEIPWKSRWGNNITKFVFRILSGVNVSDTQTGLRAFTSKLIPTLLEVGGDRYEYEMNMLVSCTKLKIPIKEVPIETIYTDEKNTSSHFRAVKDSARIYGNLLLFAGSSFLSFLVDFIVFNLFVWLIGFTGSDNTVSFSNIAARIISASFNYYLNSTYVFNSGRKAKNAVQYFLLAAVILALNTKVLTLLTGNLGIQHTLAKLITEIVFISISYTLQKFVIFRTKKQ
jgi:glycosyltransferase involved in cell wall biosynthesis